MLFFAYAHPGCISIHALLAESDNAHPEIRLRDAISIHALLAESDHNVCRDFGASRQFLSTLSLRRATVRPTGDQPSTPGFLSTLSLRRATSKLQRSIDIISISIHALLAESDFAAGR